MHNDVIKWRHFPRHWPFVKGIHQSPVNFPHKDHSVTRRFDIFFDRRLNKRLSKQSRRHRAHYDVIVMECCTGHIASHTDMTSMTSAYFHVALRAAWTWNVVPPRQIAFDQDNQAYGVINTLRPRQNGRHFADDIFKCIFFNENEWILLLISLKFVPKVRINNIPALV